MPSGASRQRPESAGRWLLAIDTSTGQAGIALHDGADTALVSWPAGRKHTTTVLPAIDRLLDLAGVRLDAVGAIAVATGPGTFTGLRVGMSLAKGFALGAERAVVEVPTLDLVAAPCVELVVPCVAVILAGRGRVVWSGYGSDGVGGQPQNSTFEELVERTRERPDITVIGELAPPQRDALREAGVRVASPALAVPRAGTLAYLGYQRWERGEVADAAAIEPLYLHGRPNPR